MNFDADDLLDRANAGDTDAQYELAARLREDGHGFPVDLQQSDRWLKLAAEGGNATAQTTLAICLRITKDPANERESVEQFDAYQDPASASRWLEMETEIANQTFTDSDNASILDAAYGCKVKIVSVFCGEALLGDMGLRTTVTSIYANNIITESGFPVYWPPDKAALNAIASTLCYIHGREWIRRNYVTF